MIQVENFESFTPMQKIQRIKSNSKAMNINKPWMSGLTDHAEINKKIAIVKNCQ